MGKKPKKPVLSDHKKVGKRFIPLMAQLFLSDARWVQRLAPEFLWLGLLHDALGKKRGAEVALKTAQAAREAHGDSQCRWFAMAGSFAQLSPEAKSEVRTALEAGSVLADLETGLEPLALHYPANPMQFLLRADGDAPLSTLKAVFADLYNRHNTSATLVQATALYLAFDAGMLKVMATSALANFPKIQDFPQTEESHRIAGAVRSTISMLAFKEGAATEEWPSYFWRRGFELEPCELRERGCGT